MVTRALEKASERRFQNLAEMRSAILDVQAGPQPEEARTVLIARPGAPPHPPTTTGPQAPAAAPVVVQPATDISIASRPSQPADAAVKTEDTPPPRMQGLRLKKEVAAPARPASTVAEPFSSTATQPRQVFEGHHLAAGGEQAFQRQLVDLWLLAHRHAPEDGLATRQALRTGPQIRCVHRPHTRRARSERRRRA